MPPQNLQHRRTHNLLLISKLLNLRDNASPFTLILDSLEQSGKPLIHEYIRRAKVFLPPSIARLSFLKLQLLNIIRLQKFKQFTSPSKPSAPQEMSRSSSKPGPKTPLPCKRRYQLISLQPKVRHFSHGPSTPIHILIPTLPATNPPI